MTIDLGRIDWVALGAIATFLLALGTVWLGWQTRAVSTRTGDLAKSTTEELDLLREQTAAMKEQAKAGQDQLAELRETRFGEFLPMLRWQSPVCFVEREQANVLPHGPSELFTMRLRIRLTNEGPGPARLKLVDASTDTGEPVRVPGIIIPSTLPADEPFSFEVEGQQQSAFEWRPRIFTLRVVYCDLFGEFDYETKTVIRADYRTDPLRTGGDESVATFVDSDERSALERRIPRNHG